ncbi:MAG: tRNA glutamyl-Q(34) synthetase GluQRS, partial [Solirubrobacterales bacterium]|nr:tRNA glutamyl-Q(34) synthetase GluQRS [Solirubrobacterales bacterium]
MEPTGRFAPSPSGPLHLGNLRTALLAWLFARSAGAGFLLRIEDLDRGRSRAEHERGQLADLHAIGIDWDGEPVRQSERTDRYRTGLLRLERAGATYPCWCTRAEVQAAADAPHGPLPEGAYPGTCRRLTAAERAERERTAGRPPSVRLDAAAATVALAGSAAPDATSAADPAVEPPGAPLAPPAVSFTDRLHGRTTGAVDDFV